MLHVGHEVVPKEEAYLLASLWTHGAINYKFQQAREIV